MSFYVHAKNLNELFEDSLNALMNDQSTWDASQTPRILSYNNLLRANSCEFDFDLSYVGFTKTRWSRYCHQYLDKQQLEDWLEGLKHISKRGENLFRSKDTVRRPREHRHGSCWLGLSFRLVPPTLVLYSRVAEFPTRAALELTMVHHVAREIKTRVEAVEVIEPVRFVWFISSGFLSCLHILPLLERRGILQEVYDREDLVGEFVKHQIDHIAKGGVKYGPTKRMDKRIQQIRAGTTVPVPIRGLSLWI